MISLVIKESRVGPVAGRHPWVFSQALSFIPEGLTPGTPVKLITGNGQFLASGYFNSYSQIAVRVWGYDEDEKMDDPFFFRRVARAYEIRRRYVESPDTDSFRVVNGENDHLPGLVVDKYGSYVVVQFHTAGIEVWKEEIIRSIVQIFKPSGIYERSDMGARGSSDGLTKRSGLLYGNVPEIIEIKENGFRFVVDVKKGQKTGFFLDQRDKRKALMKYAEEASVLNCFSYTGAFSIYALAGGAKRVVNVDTSEKSLHLAMENIRLNDLDEGRCEFINRDVKDYLRHLKDGFHVIILDPPAFIKDRRKKNEGIQGYKSINEMALRSLHKRGILVTCSCSAHLKPDDFRFLISETGGKVKRSLCFLEAYTHGIDHPQLVPFTEGEYLKCFFVGA